MGEIFIDINSHTRKFWRVKSGHRANIAYTSFRTSSTEHWYFDSGYSHHMASEKSFLVNLKIYSNNFVIFGFGGRIKSFVKVS